VKFPRATRPVIFSPVSDFGDRASTWLSVGHSAPINDDNAGIYGVFTSAMTVHGGPPLTAALCYPYTTTGNTEDRHADRQESPRAEH